MGVLPLSPLVNSFELKAQFALFLTCYLLTLISHLAATSLLPFINEPKLNILEISGQENWRS